MADVPKDLYTQGVFRVESVHVDSRPVKRDNGIAGPGYAETITGFIPQTSLRVAPVCDMRLEGIVQLSFSGMLALEKGDFVRAEIVQYNIERGKETGAIIAGDMTYEPEYKKRATFGPNESTKKIEKIKPTETTLTASNPCLEILATYQSHF